MSKRLFKVPKRLLSLTPAILGVFSPALWLFGASALGAAAPALRVASFQCDITPPPGEALVWTVPLSKVERPLQAKGVVLEAGTNRYVLCALDWCLVGNQTEASFRKALAEGARTAADRVAVHSIHQHAAPYADEGAHRLLDSVNPPILHLSSGFLDTVRTRLTAAAGKASQELAPFDQIGFAATKVEQIASERRLHGPNGKILTRFSSAAKNPQMAQAPEGNIDPYLKTITFARGGKALARLHYYATHPQTFCCDGRASRDFVGDARELVEQAEGVPQVYFTGCSGNVTAGKYNDGSAKAYDELTTRLKAAMEQAPKNTRFFPAKELAWRTCPLTLPLRDTKDHITAESCAWLQDPKQPDSSRVYKGAMRLSFVERVDQPVELNSLQIGKVHIVHLPGEPMLDYQFYAQQRNPSELVAVAGYGDCGTAYICTDQALAEGGYEPEATNVGKGSEARLKQAIDVLLGMPAVPKP